MSDLAARELRRFRTPLQRAALAFLTVVPLLYGAIYLWTNWDPYGRLDRVPVAVVNEDQPVTVEGRTVNAGQMFVDQLRHTPLLGWRFVDRAEAEQGQRDGRYYLVIEVPRDFSADLASGATGTPQRAAMRIRLDDANGFIIGKMAETVQSELERQIAAAAVSAYVQAAFGDLDTLTDGLAQARDGASRLESGADSAHAGAVALADGITRLHDGSTRLAPGARQVADGVHRLNEVAGPVLDAVAAWLPRTWRLACEITAVASLVTAKTAAGTGTIAQAARNVTDNLDLIAARHPDVATDPLFQAVRRGATTISTDTAVVADLTGRIATSAATVHEDVNRFQRDLPEVERGIATAREDLDRLDSGAAQVADGAAALDSGLAEAQGGSTRLADGTGQLADGAGQLATGLTDAAGRVPSVDPAQRARTADTLAGPVDVELTNLHPATLYGRGLAPFFFGIALWVFGIVAFLVLRPVSNRLLVSRVGAVRVAMAAWLPVFAVGLVGALLLFLVVDLGLGLDPVSVPGTLGVIALAVAAFTAIVHLLRLAFGVVGDALALVLLMIQLTSCGGLYPPETLPLPFEAVNPVLPMTHLVDALRVTVSGGEAGHAWRGAAVLGAYFVAALALLVWTVARRRNWTIGRLRPELSL